MKRLYSLVVFIVFALVLTACGGSEGDQAANNDSKNDNSGGGDVIELRMAWWGGQERHDRTLEVIELYEEKNPHVKIVPEYSGIDDYFDKLMNQLDGVVVPDIIQYVDIVNVTLY